MGERFHPTPMTVMISLLDGMKKGGISNPDTINPSLLSILDQVVWAIQLISRLYGEKFSTHVKFAWVPMIHEIIKHGKIFNWETILSNSLVEAIRKSQIDAPIIPLEFYMSFYLLDVVCASNSFVGLGWSWSLE
jgi:hypothetical protein